MKKIGSTFQLHWPIILFLSFYFSLLFYKLITFITPFYDWDESIYVELGREMTQRLSLIPLWQGMFWFDKPPLIPGFYGLVQLLPVQPELSLRIVSLITSVIVLTLFYVLYYRISKNTVIATLTVMITAFTPIFLQRAQIVNVDVFLLLGWVGYIVFYPRKYLSFVFLFIGVMSKSLLGFFPPFLFIGYLSFLFFLKKKSLKEYKKEVSMILAQIGTLALWYIIMILMFGHTFIQQHFLDSQFKRVTASIETHFGKRTFYLDLLVQQMGLFIILVIPSIFILLYQFYKKRGISKLFYSLFFVPWFLFLNLTKTKIDWYLYPVIPQFAFLSVYPLDLFKKRKWIVYSLGILIAGYILYQNIIVNPVLATHYSSVNTYYKAALVAKPQCDTLHIFVDKHSRETFDVLKRMNLTITTSNWWGGHPSIMYYFQKPVFLSYSGNEFEQAIQNGNKNTCYLIDKQDVEIVKLSSIKRLFQENEVILFVKE